MLAIEQQCGSFSLWCPIRFAQLHLVRSWGACPGSTAAGAGHVRPGRCRPSRAIEALPMAMSLPGTGSGLPAGPAAPGELAVPISGSPALAIEQQCGSFPLWCPIRIAQLHLVRSLGACPGSAAAGAGHVSPWTSPAVPGHRGAAHGHVSPWYRIRTAGRPCSSG